MEYVLLMFGDNPTVFTGDHRTDAIGIYMMDAREKLPGNDAPVHIEDHVRIGANVTILRA